MGDSSQPSGVTRGPRTTACGNLSKQLNTVVQRQPVCLRALVAATLLTQESKKLTFAQPTTIYSSYSLGDLLSHEVIQTLLPSTLQQFHLPFIEAPHITLGKCPHLNPASLLPVPTETTTHSCLEILDSKLSPFPNIKPADSTASLPMCINGSSFLHQGTQRTS